LNHKDKVKVVGEFISKKLAQNTTARVLNHDMNFELTEYAIERGCYISSIEVRGLLEIFYIPSNGQYHYIEVELRQ
jgi:hypothetical protein